MDDEMTPEDVQSKYEAAMDSVRLLNGSKPLGLTDDQWAARVKRNVEHLKIMVAKDYWTDQDLTPLHDAISANEVSE